MRSIIQQALFNGEAAVCTFLQQQNLHRQLGFVATKPLLDGAAVSPDNFRPDDAFPAAWYKARPKDYTGSRYHRGHIAPSADRTRYKADKNAIFLMTNMMPQAPEVNRGVWGDLVRLVET